MPVRIIQVAGFLGSGKTTMIILLGETLSTELNKRVAIIVNDFGEVNIDGKIIEEYGFKTMEISGGCICCELSASLAATIKALEESFKPDIILIEPSGIALPSQVYNFPETLSYDRAPILVLFDIANLDLLLDPEGLPLIRNQIKEADIVAINKIDTVNNSKKLEEAYNGVRKLNPKAKIIYTSGKTGKGLKELIQILTIN
jgi:G3E family GTPase